MLNYFRKLFGRGNAVKEAPPPAEPERTIDIAVDIADYPSVADLAGSGYAKQAGSLLPRLARALEDARGTDIPLPDAREAIHDSVTLCDLAFFDLNTRYQQYGIVRNESSRLLNEFIDHFKELYSAAFLEKIDRRVDELNAFLESRKLAIPEDEGEENTSPGWTGKITRFSKKAIKSVTTNFEKLFRETVDGLKTLTSFIPGLGIKGEYSRRLDESLGEEALRSLHGETIEAIRPEIERRLREKIERLRREVPDIARNYSMKSAAPEDFIGTSIKLTGFTAIMSGAGTLVLTAGWHTIAWSTANLLLPMLLYVVLPGSIIAMIGLQNRDLNKRKETLAEAKKNIHDYIREHTVLEIAERIRTEYGKMEEERERELVAGLFPGLEGGTITLVKQAMHELRSLAEKLGSLIEEEPRAPYAEEMLERCAAITMENPLADALLLAACLDSLLGFLNKKLKLGGATLRDGGTAGMIAALRERGLIDENAFNALTRARRIRNRLAHNVQDFLALPETRQAAQGRLLMDGIRALEIPVREKVMG